MMMTACDLNGTTKPWEIQKEVRSVFFPSKNSLYSNLVNDSIAYTVLHCTALVISQNDGRWQCRGDKKGWLISSAQSAILFHPFSLITGMNSSEIRPSLASLGSIFPACERITKYCCLSMIALSEVTIIYQARYNCQNNSLSSVNNWEILRIGSVELQPMTSPCGAMLHRLWLENENISEKRGLFLIYKTWLLSI